jgi:hypothetical protein
MAVPVYLAFLAGNMPNAQQRCALEADPHLLSLTDHKNSQRFIRLVQRGWRSLRPRSVPHDL